MFVRFKSDYSYHGKGFTANYTTIPTKCGGKFTATEGFIYSPNYPKNYNKNETCEYFIQIDEGHAVEIKFEDVDLFRSENCSDNYVKVHDGPTAAYPVLTSVCGNVVPNDTIRSSYNEVLIEFRSHTFSTTKGFKLKYYKSCGSIITTQSNGVIEVHHDEFSENTVTCTWTIISSDASKHVHLTISQIQSQYYCDPDDAPLKIYNGETTGSPLIGQYCGPKIPPLITSDGRALTVYIASQITFFATYSVYDSQCGGSLKAAEGYFSSPGYPKKYASDIECEWTISIAEGNHVSLNFIEFSLLQSGNCNTDYLEIRSHNASGRLLGVFCGTNTPANITHVGSIWLLFKGSKITAGDTTITAKGFYAEYTLNQDNELTGPKGEIESPLYPLSIMDYKTFTWKITVATKKRIQLSFKEFYMDAKDSIDDECYFSTFEVFDGVDDTATSLGKHCGLMIPPPIKSTSNIMYIRVDYSSTRLGSRFKVEWEEIEGTNPSTSIVYNTECNSTEGGININEVHSYTLISPGYPGGYATDLKCEWIFSTIPMNHLLIYFNDIDLGLNSRLAIYRRCDSLSDIINIYQKHFYDNDWQKVQSLCARDDFTTSIRLTDLIKVEFLTNRYLNGTGFKAKIIEGCGGWLRASTGYILYHNGSMIGTECQWNITVGSTKTIELVFEEMNIEHDITQGCDNFLMIRNGKFSDSPLLGTGKYCGTTLPAKLHSTGNNLYIIYKGSPGITGFRLKYQEVSANCGGNIILSTFDNFTEISSPNYPNIPNPHIECLWRITAPTGEVLRIDFEDRFDLTSKFGCKIEYVEVRDGGTEYSTLIGRYCQKAPSSQFSTDNMMLIKFFTDTDEPKNGFKAKISLSRCGGTVRGTLGTISHVAGNVKNHNCTWHIVGPVDHYLILNFVQLDVPCVGNYISLNENSLIEQAINTNGSSLGKFCGTTVPAYKITSLSNEVVVTLNNNGKFTLKYNASQTECGGSLTSESGVIESPGYPYMNHLHRNCQWDIEVPEGRRIVLQLLDIDLGSSSRTFDRGLAIFDGSSLRVRLALLNSIVNATTYETSSNKMILFFWSSRKSEHRGFKANYSSNLPSICEGDFNEDSGVITNPKTKDAMYHCDWIHRRKNPLEDRTFAISLTIQLNANYSKPLLETHNCIYALAYVQVTNNDKKDLLGRLCFPTIQPIIIRSPFPTTKLMAIASLFKMNFTATYNTYTCGGIISTKEAISTSPFYPKVGKISSPNWPSKPTKSYECAWQLNAGLGETINVTFKSINLGDDCEKSYLSIYNGELTSHPRIGKYCKQNKPEMLISQGNKLYMEFHYDQTSTGTGFSLEFDTITSDCGGIFHDKTRNIHSPNYGKGDYPNNAECLWIIESSPGYHIELTFVDRFYIEQSNNCSNDFIEVWSWEEESWVSLGRNCGRDTPKSLVSKGERMKILFRSNDNIPGGGFKAKWEWLCGGEFMADSKTRYLVSPGYPDVYQNNLKCEYTIDTKSEAMNIRFLDFDLEAGDPECKFDNLTITTKNAGGSFYNTKNTYCDGNMPPSIRMKGTLLLTFRTDPWLNKRGFKLEYKDDSCGGEVTKEGVIERTAPSHETGAGRFYQPRIRCIWNITAPVNQVVILTIKKLGMSLNTMCYGQSVEIFKNLSLNFNNRLAQLCGNLHDEYPITSETGQMAVKLDNLPSYFGGFLAEVRFSHGPAEGCGGQINLTETKIIQSPNLPNLDCAWNIIAPRDHQIDIKINYFYISSCSGVNSTNSTCGCSMLEIRDGASPLSEKMETFCVDTVEADLKTNIRTSAQNGHIRFFMRGQRNNAFKATLTPVASICGTTILTASREKKILTSPNYNTSGNYPAYIKCSYAISTTNLFDRLVIHFIEFDLTDEITTTDQGKECTGDFLQIFEDPNTGLNGALGSNVVFNGGSKQASLLYTDAKGRHLFCGKDEIPFDFYTSGKSVTISLVSKGRLPKGKGFKLEYSLTGCNRNYTQLQGRINNGNSKDNCQFSIIVPEGRTISVYFSTFYIYYSQNCSLTALQVREGSPTGPILQTICGYRLPDPVFSTTNKLYFNAFNKRAGGSLLKYDMLYVSSTDGPGCGGEIFNNKGKIYSPMYPNAFRNDTVCTWTIKAPVGLHLAMKFTNFDIQGSCEQTNVKVTTDNTNVVLCKDYRVGPVMRSKTSIKIQYTSSIHNGGSGWILNFLAVSSDITDVN